MTDATTARTDEVAVRRPFSITDPLPVGVVAIEASAGTGKTFALSSLATRVVAEGRAEIGEMVLVSFTEAATAELRGRLRSRFVTARDHLEAVLGGGDTGVGGDDVDELLVFLATGSDHEVQRRRDLLARAVTDFDAATISTIHGLCSRVLASSTDGAGDAEVVATDDDLAEVVNDVVVARAAQAADIVGDHDADDASRSAAVDLLDDLRPDRILAAARFRLAVPDGVPFDVTPLTETIGKRKVEQRLRVRASAVLEVVDEVVEEVCRRRAASRRRTLDAIITDTRRLIRGPEGPGVIAHWRSRCRFVLLDEFQDTDRVQWDIFRELFVDGSDTAGDRTGVPPGTTVVIVGDPKQSIYGFRSAELSVYLEAVSSASTVRSLGTNWRSDAVVLAGVERLLDGCEFGGPGAAFQPVDPAPGRPARRLIGDDGPGLALRVVDAPDGKIDAGTARRAVIGDLVREVSDLLDGTRFVHDDADGAPRPLGARDIAVLTASNNEAMKVVSVLSAAGIPAASATNDTVFGSTAATQWRLLARALDRPSSAGAVRAVALGWFMGLTPAELAALDDEGHARLHDRVRSWAAALDSRGVPALVAELRRSGLYERLLARVGGGRDLTDVEHLAELLQISSGSRPVPPIRLLQLLENGADLGDGVSSSDILARRIDRDDDAVQVMTVHKSKGLEFGVVLCPFLWTSSSVRGIRHASLGGARTFDPLWVAGLKTTSKFHAPIENAVQADLADERLRQLYVALTRARHRTVVWWAANNPSNPLRTVLAEAIGGPAPTTAAGARMLTAALGEHRALAVTAVDPASVVRPTGAIVRRADASVPPGEVARFDRVLDRTWRIWSFSAIAAEESSRTERLATPSGGGFDEPALDELPPTPDASPGTRLAPGAEVVHPLADAPRGREFGTLVHRVLERVDFSAPDLRAALHAEADADAPGAAFTATLAAGLEMALQSPLGGPEGARRLADITRRDRLDELEFHLPLAPCRAGDIGQRLVSHLAADDPLAPWAAALAAGRFDIPIEGLLTGSIDLVARSTSAERYWVADYKTNHLGGVENYGRHRLVAEMEHHHYPLQATLYLVALHRFLRGRLRHYRPEQHLAGAAYLFVRGMHPSSDEAEPSGVLWWTPPAAAIIAVDDVLSGGR